MFSVLMSVYAGEKAGFLRAALESLQRQTEAPAEIVLVEDGPLGTDTREVINGFRSRLNLVSAPLIKGVGLGSALNHGLKIASQPWIMRFDTDDVCIDDRVRLQREYVESGNAELFGGQIEEFEHEPSRPVRKRVVPCSHSEIISFMARRNPFNHMTVCYPREAILKVGGYPDCKHVEDYVLWARLARLGVRMANLPQVLVRARIGNGLIRRRGGLTYVRAEIRLQQELFAARVKSRSRALRDGALRSSVFMAPPIVRKWAYSRLLRTST